MSDVNIKKEAVKKVIESDFFALASFNNISNDESELAVGTNTILCLSEDYGEEELMVVSRALAELLCSLNEAKIKLLERNGIDPTEEILAYSKIKADLDFLFNIMSGDK